MVLFKRARLFGKGAALAGKGNAQIRNPILIQATMTTMMPGVLESG